MEQGLRISQCMIVRNEEANIERALSWGRGVVSEQIVVDTGSTDRTVELAEQTGARVYHFPWIDDFSAAKNYAISKARGDWIAFLDADEYLPPEDGKKLISILKSCDDQGIEAVSARMLEVDQEGSVKGAGTLVRFFRGRIGLCYHRRIHEQLGFSDGRPMKLGDAVSELTIYHSGYSGSAYEEKQGSQRNRRLIEQELKENPQSYEMMGYMGDECFAGGQLEEAQQWYWRSVRLMPEILPENDQRSAFTYARLMSMLGEQERQEEMTELYEKAVRLFPREGDFDYLMGGFYAVHGDYAQGIVYLGKALEKLEQYGSCGRSMFMSADLEGVYEMLADCCYRCGRLRESVQLASAILKDSPYNMKLLYILLRCFDQESRGTASDRQAYARSVSSFLGKIYDFSFLKDRLFVLKASEESGYDEVYNIFSAMLNEDERAVLNRSGLGKEDTI